MELTKKYRIVYNEKTKEMINPLHEFNEGVTYVHSSMVGVDFDTLKDAEKYINDNGLWFGCVL